MFHLVSYIEVLLQKAGLSQPNAVRAAAWILAIFSTIVALYAPSLISFAMRMGLKTIDKLTCLGRWAAYNLKVLKEHILSCNPWSGVKTEIDWSDFASDDAKAALQLREVTFRQLLDLVLETEAIDRTNLEQEAKRLRLLESTTLTGRMSNAFNFMRITKTRSSFTFSTKERKQEWKERFGRQLRPFLAIWVDKLAEKMSESLHRSLPDMYDKAPKFDVMIAVAVTHCRILDEVRPLLDDMLAHLETEWSEVADLVDKEMEIKAIKRWVDCVVKPSLQDVLDQIEPPTLNGEYSASTASDVPDDALDVSESTVTVQELAIATGVAGTSTPTIPQTPRASDVASTGTIQEPEVATGAARTSLPTSSQTPRPSDSPSAGTQRPLVTSTDPKVAPLNDSDTSNHIEGSAPSTAPPAESSQSAAKGKEKLDLTSQDAPPSRGNVELKESEGVKETGQKSFSFGQATSTSNIFGGTLRPAEASSTSLDKDSLKESSENYLRWPDPPIECSATTGVRIRSAADRRKQASQQ
ncbi:hypothetical protein PM082_000589 [Marasmius tenuissimus]|nr:hypothetical protein PM082_000589 [Marasmius tenuissimus]